jgi:FkbM family methyltransferase
MNNIFKDGALVFDIGANIGQSVERLAKEGAGVIVSVEPCVENYTELIKCRHNYPCCVPIHAAVWSECGLVEVRLAKNQPGWSSVDCEHWSKAYPGAEWGEPQCVASVTLDQLIAFHGVPEFVKIDVEGGELNVLRGLTKKIPSLSFEFHHEFPDDAQRCFKECRNLGFTKACWSESDIDLETVPVLGIDECAAAFKAANPKWGNVVVV